jgi:hypothetical protein
MNKAVTKFIKIFLKLIGFLAGAFLFILISGFVAVKFNWTKTAGNVDENTGLYNYLANTLNSSFLPSSRDTQDINDARVYCQLYILSDYADNNAATIFKVYEQRKSYDLVQKMILAVKIRLNNREAVDERLSICDRDEKPSIDKNWLASRLQNPVKVSVFSWQNEEPWQVIRQAVIKDKDTLNLVGAELNISPRLILSVAIVEQLRLYYTQRELFEQVFKPLKILANANKMAWGVMSIKEAAAIKTEQTLKDKTSVFYLGSLYENMLNFKTDNPDTERYNRLTDSKNHYYSYLYGGLIIKQATTQWQKAGYDIAARPEILATLFNVGLQNSKPKKDPLVGGSIIEINGSQYVFGSLAYEFYYSGDLLADFPYSY